jgi:hypothetical protein
VTLVEVLVAAGLLGMVMLAVMSFYIEAIAVSAKRDETSARLRRFHIGLDKMEQILREARVLDVLPRSVMFLKLSDQSELDGFPNYEPDPAQFVSAEQGVVMLQAGKEIPVLPTEPGENVIFSWVQEQPTSKSDVEVKKTILNIALYYSGGGKRSGLFFHRTINVPRY